MAKRSSSPRQKRAAVILATSIAGVGAAALPPAVYDVRGVFRDDKNWLLLNNGSIVSEDGNEIVTLNPKGKWELNGKAMPDLFQQWAAIVSDTAKEEKNETFIGYFQYKNGSINLWTDSEAIVKGKFGKFEYIRGNGKWIFDKNGNGIFDAGEESMSEAFNKMADAKLSGTIKQVFTLREQTAKAEADMKQYQDMEKRLNESINEKEAEILKLRETSGDLTKSSEYQKLKKDLEEMTANKDSIKTAYDLLNTQYLETKSGLEKATAVITSYREMNVKANMAGKKFNNLEEMSLTSNKQANTNKSLILDILEPRDSEGQTGEASESTPSIPSEVKVPGVTPNYEQPISTPASGLGSGASSSSAYAGESKSLSGNQNSQSDGIGNVLRGDVKRLAGGNGASSEERRLVEPTDPDTAGNEFPASNSRPTIPAMGEATNPYYNGMPASGKKPSMNYSNVPKRILPLTEKQKAFLNQRRLMLSEPENSAREFIDTPRESEQEDLRIAYGRKSIQADEAEAKRGWSASVDGGVSFEDALKGAELEAGLRYNVGTLGIGGVFGIGLSGDNEIRNYEGPASPTTGRHAKGTITEKNPLRLNAGLELKFGPVLIKGGYGATLINTETVEEIFGRNNNSLGSSNYSDTSWTSDFFMKAGVEFPIEKLRTRILGGGKIKADNSGVDYTCDIGINLPLGQN